MHSPGFVLGPNPHLLLHAEDLHWGQGFPRQKWKHHRASAQGHIHLLCLRTCSVYLLYYESDLSSKSSMPAYMQLLCTQRLSSCVHLQWYIIWMVKTYRCSWPTFRYLDYHYIAQKMWRDLDESIWENYTQLKALFPCLSSVERTLEIQIGPAEISSVEV